MIDLTWKVFSETGDIETYLLLKEIEDDPNLKHLGESVVEDASISIIDSNI